MNNWYNLHVYFLLIRKSETQKDVHPLVHTPDAGLTGTKSTAKDSICCSTWVAGKQSLERLREHISRKLDEVLMGLNPGL